MDTMNRVTRLHAAFLTAETEAVLIMKPENMQYFSGFSGGEGALVIMQEETYLITDFRYVEQAQQEAPTFHLVKQECGLADSVTAFLAKLGAVGTVVEGNFMQTEFWLKLQERLPNMHWKVTSLDALRTVKDEFEINEIRRAAKIADDAFAYVLENWRGGMTEIEVAAELEYQMRRLGSERPAFPTIVASGHRGSLPHGIASEKVIENGDFVTMDFGAVYHGYHSDITRTFCAGKASQKQKEIYQIVLDAQLLGVDTVKPGIYNQEVDAVVRDYIASHGYKENFGHGLGHGVGLEIHELPRLSPLASREMLTEGMLVTIEPGIYLPDWGGIRIEDTVLLTPNGCDIITKSTKKLLEL